MYRTFYKRTSLQNVGPSEAESKYDIVEEWFHYGHKLEMSISNAKDHMPPLDNFYSPYPKLVYTSAYGYNDWED